MMPSCRKGLKQEALAGEAGDVSPFGKLLRGKAVAVGGESTVDIWFGEPLTAEEPVFRLDKLHVGRFGDAFE